MTDTYVAEQGSGGSTKIKKIDSKKEFVGIKKDKVYSCLFFYLPLFLIILFSLPGHDPLFQIQEKERIKKLFRMYAILLFGIIGFLLLCYFDQMSLVSFCILVFLVFVALLIFFKGFMKFPFFGITVLVLFSGILYGAIYPYPEIENNVFYRMIIFELILCFVGFLVIAFVVRKLYLRIKKIKTNYIRKKYY